MAQENSKDVWFLDNGCSNHMTRNRELFSNLDDFVTSEIKLGNNSIVPIMGKGVINVLAKKGEKKFIPNVYYVPTLTHNLMSVGQLDGKGYKVIFKDNACTILDENSRDKFIAKVEMSRNMMYPLQIHGIQGMMEANFKAEALDQPW